MKKAVIISCFNYFENRMELVMRYLSEKGYDCTYITSDFDHIEKKHFEFDTALQIPTRAYYRNISPGRLYSHMLFAKDAFNEVRKIGPDVLVVMAPPNSIAKEAAKYKKKHPEAKFILDIYDLWPETLPFGKIKKLLALPLSFWANFRNNGIKRADLIFTECNLYREVLAKELSEKNTHTLYLSRPNATVEGDISAPINDGISLCYLGSINNIIDIDLISALIAEISKKTTVKLHIIGDGENRDSFIEKSKAAGADVVFHGKVYDTAEKQAIFDSCDFGLNIMKSSVCVGLTMKSLDYFAGGLPVLNTIEGDTHDFVERSGMGINIDRENISETAEKIIDCASEINKRMRENTVSVFGEYFSEEAFTDALSRGFEGIGI